MAGRVKGLGAIAAALVAGILVAAPSAHATPSALDQYIPAAGPDNTSAGLPTGEIGGTDGTGAGGQALTLSPADKALATATEEDGGSSAGIELPLASGGYPVTPFVILVVVLLLGALAIRLLAPVLGRRGSSAE